MNAPEKRPGCESDNLEPGRIQLTGKVCFRPENTKFLTPGTSDALLSANICPDCGHVMLIGDLIKVTKLADKAKPH